MGGAAVVCEWGGGVGIIDFSLIIQKVGIRGSFCYTTELVAPKSEQDAILAWYNLDPLPHAREIIEEVESFGDEAKRPELIRRYGCITQCCLLCLKKRNPTRRRWRK